MRDPDFFEGMRVENNNADPALKKLVREQNREEDRVRVAKRRNVAARASKQKKILGLLAGETCAGCDHVEEAFVIPRYFAEEANASALQDLLGEIEVMDEEVEAESVGKSILTGKTLVFTGSLARFGRNQARKFAERAGARVVTGLSGSVDYLIVGEKPGSKARLAGELGVEVMDEGRFLEMCGQGVEEEGEEEGQGMLM